MKGLQDDPDPSLPGPGEVVLPERGEIGAGDSDRAAGRPLQPRQYRHQRRFSAARRPEQGNAFAARDLKRDTAQDLDPARSGAERERDIRSVDNVGAGHEGE
jgi:hypothetical protein